MGSAMLWGTPHSARFRPGFRPAGNPGYTDSGFYENARRCKTGSPALASGVAVLAQGRPGPRWLRRSRRPRVGRRPASRADCRSAHGITLDTRYDAPRLVILDKRNTIMAVLGHNPDPARVKHSGGPLP
jgi:hypothetical protein